jgi:hypothetical protein
MDIESTVDTSIHCAIINPRGNASYKRLPYRCPNYSSLLTYMWDPCIARPDKVLCCFYMDEGIRFTDRGCASSKGDLLLCLKDQVTRNFIDDFLNALSLFSAITWSLWLDTASLINRKERFQKRALTLAELRVGSKRCRYGKKKSTVISLCYKLLMWPFYHVLERENAFRKSLCYGNCTVWTELI